ncbi:MFS transporter [Paraburkholderia unamae]|uniref:AAHS family 4-hydroxybenzoate transporter-like MFS transporter n=1 Tax=Paraburkholderia unamae TaxID=219649 RepID=A0ABX5KSL9_9BURK|nr:MFS transporter [Paraburkholderia unamae]PVX85888.1 AAHS family 4-hydroxybenzoate transporter-like MFS transporter [Paraburkholderia unamae]
MNARSTERAALITLVCFAVSMIDGFDTLMLSFVAPLISHALQIDHAALGRVFGAGFIGTVVGSIVVGPAADRFGRKPMLIVALALTGLLTLACAFATSAPELALLRFIGGLGMGGAIPPVAAITAECASPRQRSSLVILMFIGFPLGAVVGGAISAALMIHYGWQIVFWMGGAFALAMLVPVIWLIPAQTGVSEAPTRGHARLGAILAQGRAAPAFALWCGVLASMIVSGFLVSFIPTILNMNGVPPARAALGAVVLNVGAIVGALGLSWIVRRREPFRPVATSFVGGALLTCALGLLIGVGNALFGMLFLVGAFLVGGQLTFPAIASRLFPSAVRASGVGWTMAIGRLGSIIGPVIGGLMLAHQVSFDRLFVFAGLLALFAAGGVALASFWGRGEGLAGESESEAGASLVVAEGKH